MKLQPEYWIQPALQSNTSGHLCSQQGTSNNSSTSSLFTSASTSCSITERLLSQDCQAQREQETSKAVIALLLLTRSCRSVTAGSPNRSNIIFIMMQCSNCCRRVTHNLLDFDIPVRNCPYPMLALFRIVVSLKVREDPITR